MSSQTQKLRNVLVLTCDQLRWDALGCTGSPVARTSNLDQLANRSVRFDRCYTQAPSCAPARHSMATGRYPHAHGRIVGNDPVSGFPQIAHALEPLGYRRIDIGRPHWNDPAIGSGYDITVDSKGWVDGVAREALDRYEWEWQDTTRRTTGGPSTRTRDEYRGKFVATHAIAQIEAAVKSSEQFFCWVDVTEPHPPFYPPREYYQAIDQSAIELPEQPADATPPAEIVARQKDWSHLTEIELRQMVAAYHGLASLADSYCGLILDALGRLGVRDETIVLFTSDHGDQLWEHQIFLKKCMYEGSVHVPLFVSVPGVAPTDRNELVEHVDLFPTICTLLGAPIPESVQGRTLTPLLGPDPKPVDWRPSVFAQVDDLKMIRTDDWKLNLHAEVPGELYDLNEDCGEYYNVLDEPGSARIVEDLQRRLVNHCADGVGDTRGHLPVGLR